MTLSLFARAASPSRLSGARGATLASAVLLLAAGCTVGPDFERPDAPPGAGYTPGTTPTTTTSANIPGGEAQKFAIGRDIPADWWTVFQSKELDTLVRRAIANNPTMEAAQQALRQARELRVAQVGQYFPQLSAQFAASRNLTPTAAVSPASSSGNPYYSLITPQLNVSFIPDVWGANKRTVEGLQAQEENARFQLEATYVTLASNVVAAALQEASLREQIEATKEIIRVNEASLKILHDQFRLGYAMRLDVAAQEAALAAAQAQLPPLQKQFEQTRDQIRALVGNLPNQDVTETFDIKKLQLPTEPPLSLPSQIIQQRPDVREAEAQMHAASAQVGVAIAAMLPQFTITGQAGLSASTLSNLATPGTAFWTIAGGLTQPLFDGLTLLHKRRAADAALAQAQAQYKSTVIAAFQNVADTLHALTSDADALRAAVAAEKAAKVTLDLTAAQQKFGYVPYLTLLQAQQAWQTAKIALVQAKVARYSDTAALYQALGGGWWNRPENLAASK